MNLPEEVAFFIAQRLRTNVRELEGALNRVKAMQDFKGGDIDIDFVRDTLKDILALQERLVTIENIQKVVAEYYRIKVSDLKSKKSCSLGDSSSSNCNGISKRINKPQFA